MIIYGGASLLLLLFLIGPIRGRTLRRLNRLAPGSIVFTISNRRQFADALSLAAVGTELGEQAATFTSAPCVTADSLGVTFWDNTPLSYIGFLDWTQIATIEARDYPTTFRRWTASAIVLSVEVGGAVVDVPLLSPNGTREMYASRREGAWLARELESLRSACIAA
jgi:hypothetical protein